LTILCALALLFVFPFVAVLLYQHSDEDALVADKDSDPKTPVISSDDDPADEDDRNSSASKEATKPEEEKPSITPSMLAVRKSQLGRMQARLRQVRSKWDDLSTTASEWHGELRKRLAGDEGRKLASDQYLVERYMAIRDSDRMPQTEIADMGQLLDQFDEDLVGIEATVEGADWEVEEEPVLGELAKLEEQISVALEPYKEHLLMVKVLLGQAAGLEPDRLSLDEVIERIEGEKEKMQIDTIRKARREAEDTTAAALAANAKRRQELEDEIARIRDQIETDQRMADAAEEARQAKHAEAQREKAAEKAELARQFERQFPAVEPYLTPFTSLGYAQPAGRTYERTTTKGPVSFTSLLGAGILGDDRDSVNRFYMSTVAGRNDRKLGAFPPHSYSSGHFDRHYETILKVQTFLREFGPVMVEKKMLAP
jgi:hypothetical protein